MLTTSFVDAVGSSWAPIPINNEDQFVVAFTRNHQPDRISLVTGATVDLDFSPGAMPAAASHEYCHVTFESQWEWTKFQSLKGRWLKERGARSSITEVAMSPSYQRIIAMGPCVVPMILREMQCEGDDPDQWFWALQALTGADPITDEIRGDYFLMSKAWLAWARKKGYAW
jgi:hypothetical protein